MLRVLDAWRGLGGRLAYGTAEGTSVFLMLDRPGQQTVWPAAVYPSGRVEVVFQYLQYRPPFDDVAVRDDLRRRLNAIPGVSLPEAKLALRRGCDSPRGMCGRPWMPAAGRLRMLKCAGAVTTVLECRCCDR